MVDWHKSIKDWLEHHPQWSSLFALDAEAAAELVAEYEAVIRRAEAAEFDWQVAKGLVCMDAEQTAWVKECIRPVIGNR